ncbi:MAG: hypothetical protein MUF08_02820 [Burkholderiaceae bacterium]|jgi:hypothetical protein|nr:hypothetical protein [Burkholderiaceae bacterium]MCU0963995.1 hypothetical protein [Burkholderiaceae bacterium]
MSKKLVSTMLLALAALGFGGAHADGDSKPKRGGTVQSANHMNFELVAQADGAAIYIDDHGKPVPVAGASGKLTVLSGADKSEAELKPAGDKLEAKGIKLASGSKVVASVTMADKKSASLRFTVK